MDKSREQLQEKQGMVDDGFSSEEEVYTKNGPTEEDKKNDNDKSKQQKLEVKYILPEPQQIKSRSYSLQPDKLTGWGTKADQPNPIPTTFGNRHLDGLISQMLTNPDRKFQVVYLGPRYENTFYAWRDKPFKFPYSHISMPKNIKYKKRPFLGQNPQVEQSVYFDSIFESGNLDLSIKVNSQQYDLFVRVDSNTRGHFNWFNFILTGLRPKEKYRFNICNLQRGFCLYTRGMRPYMKSLKKKKDVWKQAGSNVTYAKKVIRFAKHFGFDPIKQWTLSFQIQTDIQNDQIQVSYCVPYTYSNMLEVIEDFKQKVQKKNILKQLPLCISLGGLPIPMLTITQPEKDEQKHEKKKCIMICGRVHPGESNGSFMMEGFLKFICGQSPQAKYLRKQIVFKIIPMLNPDGVVMGNYRTGLSGKDFNRQYRNPDKDIFPEVYFFKKLVTEMKIMFKNNLFMFLDLHGHSTKKNVFAYGPQFSMIDKFYYEARIFAKMLEKQNNMFRYHSCIFKVSEGKLSTARAILMKKINIPLTFTIEASNGFYHDRQRLVSVPFEVDQWVMMGSSIGKSISQYVQYMLTIEKARKAREKQRVQAIKVKKDKLLNKSPSSSPPKKQSVANLITLTQDAKIQKIYDQILKQQKQGTNQVNSDDNISEGSSDKEDDKDDLSKKQLQTLFNSIKNNKKLGKNKQKNGKLNKIDLTFEEVQSDKDEEVEVQKIENFKQKFRIKKAWDTIDKPNQNNSQIIEQVFIAEKGSLFNGKNKRSSSPPKYFSPRREKSLYRFSRTQNSTKIIDCKFQEGKKSDFLQTISLFPSFASKNKNTILVSQRNQNRISQQKITREVILSSIGESPRSIKLFSNKDFDKTLNIFGVRHKNQLRKKLEHIGFDNFQKSYSKFNRTGFQEKKKQRKPSITFSKVYDYISHGLI